MKHFSFSGAFTAVLLLLPVARADVTMHYENTFKLQTGLPGLPANAVAAMPTAQSTTIRLKGNKGYSNAGPRNAFLEDFDTGQMTMMDLESKKFATLPIKDFGSRIAGAVPAMPEAAKAMMESMKVDVASQNTGKTDTIQGVQAEETQITLTVAMPGFAGSAGAGGASAGAAPMMSFVMHIWTAKPDEAFHNPAIRQLVGHNIYAYQVMNPAAVLPKLFASMPGMAKATESFQQFSGAKSVILRSHGELFMPMLAMMAKQMSKNGQNTDIDPAAPIMQMNSEVTELSTASIDDSIFQVPKDFTPASIEELMQSMMPAVPPGETRNQ